MYQSHHLFSIGRTLLMIQQILMVMMKCHFRGLGQM
jgi:hypothetical protein